MGTAGSYEGFLLVEQPLPWPADVAAIPELAPVAEVAASANLRLQAIVGTAAEQTASSPSGLRRVICYQVAAPGTGDGAPLARTEALLSPRDLGPGAAELIAALPASDTKEDQPGPGTSVTDILVCTHGRRDMCCGARGTELASALQGQPIAAPPLVARVWRTSHTGGHRFAPTAVVLPSGTLWAWADVELIEQVANRSGPVEAVLDRYRGFACLGAPQHQAVELAVLARVGWPLMEGWRRSQDLPQRRVRLETERCGIWDAFVREGRRVAQPDCRTDPAATTKFGVEWVVEDLRPVPGV